MLSNCYLISIGLFWGTITSVLGVYFNVVPYKHGIMFLLILNENLNNFTK